MKRFGLIFGVMCTVLSGGCSLKAPLNLDGAQCSDETHVLEAVIFNQEVCYPEDVTGERSQTCERFADSFEYGYCPGEAKFCINTSDKPDEIRNVCSPIKCDITKAHEYNGQCEENSLDNCGQHGYRCEDNIPGWQNGECRNGVLGKGKGVIGAHCHAKECSIGYDLDDDNGVCNPTLKCGTDEYYYYNEAIDKPSCEPNSVENCGKQGYRCDKTAGWSDGTCEAGQCVPNACANGYKLEAGQCVVTMNCKLNQHIEDGQCVDDDEKHCGSPYNDCTMNLAWKSGLCLNGSCVATACSSGYAVDEKNKRCSPIPCDGYWLNDVCQPYDVDNCGRVGRKCSTRNPRWADGECVEGECVVKSCIAGYELKNGQCESTCNEGEHKAADGKTCEPDSVTACGAFNNDCTEDKVSISPVCQNGRCYANDCIPNYRAVDGICEQIKACPVGYHAKDETCVPDTDAACGDAMINCNQYQNATSGLCSIGGACIATACKAGYHLYNGACEENSDNHCGAHEVLCDSSLHEMCNTEKGTCDCEDGYERYDGVCQVEGYSPLCDEENYATLMYEGEEIKAWCVKTVDDLKNVKTGYPADNTDNAFFLVRDLDIGDAEWNPNELVNSKFFGNNHAIYGKICRAGDAALFSKINGSYIRDLYLYLDVVSTAENGKVAGLTVTSSYSTIDNVQFDGSVKGYGDTAGIVVNDQTSSFYHCTVKGIIESLDDSGGGSAGGLAVGLSNNSVVDKCYVDANIKGKNVGGIATRAAHNVNIQLSHYSGNINAYGWNYTGGIVGDMSYGTIVSNCGVDANIVSSGDRVGGIIGLLSYGESISNYFYGTVRGMNMVGGIVGNGGDRDKIIQCAAIGDVYGSGEDVGGLFGSGVSYVNYSVSMVDVHGARSGALVGTAKSSFKISNTYTFGKIDGGSYKFNDVYNNGGTIVKDGFVGSWQSISSSYFKNYISIDGDKLYSNDELLLDVLTKSSIGYVWGDRRCDITIGPAEGNHVVYYLPIPIAIPDIPNCTRIWINEPY